MTFSDIFKSGFLENVTSVSLLDMALALVLAFGVGLFVFFIYKKTYSGVMYSSSFGVTLIALTMITTLVILAVTSKEEYSRNAGFVIGLTLTLVHLLGIYFTGTSVNPARSIGPALFVGGEALSCVWVFIVGPLVGGAIAAICWKWLGKE